jgi:hypothetical protein
MQYLAKVLSPLKIMFSAALVAPAPANAQLKLIKFSGAQTE